MLNRHHSMTSVDYTVNTKRAEPRRRVVRNVSKIRPIAFRFQILIIVTYRQMKSVIQITIENRLKIQISAHTARKHARPPVANTPGILKLRAMTIIPVAIWRIQIKPSSVGKRAYFAHLSMRIRRGNRR
jgi:hypothetical protein